MTCNIILNFKELWVFVSVHRLNYLPFNDLDAHTVTYTHTDEYMHEFMCITKDIKY